MSAEVTFLIITSKRFELGSINYNSEVNFLKQGVVLNGYKFKTFISAYQYIFLIF